jgi:hypothetical protein
LELSRLIDHWSVLGLPLQVTLAYPSSAEHDGCVTTGLEVDEPSLARPVSEDSQAQWIDEYVAVLLAKPSVVAVFWNHFCDAQPHRFPHAGLLRHDGFPKPALNHLLRLRKTHWP